MPSLHRSHYASSELLTVYLPYSTLNFKKAEVLPSLVHQWNPALSPVLGTLLTFRTCAGYTESSLMIPKALIQKKTVADIDFCYHSLFFFFFFRMGKQSLKGEATFQRLQRKSVAQLKSEPKRIWCPELLGTTTIHKPWVWNGQEVMASGEKQYMTGGRYSLPSLCCICIHLRESHWVDCSRARGAHLHGKKPSLPSNQASEKKIQSLPLTQTLQNTISYYVSKTKFNPPVSRD